jgi:hypothetical protein
MSSLLVLHPYWTVTDRHADQMVTSLGLILVEIYTHRLPSPTRSSRDTPTGYPSPTPSSRDTPTDSLRLHSHRDICLLLSFHPQDSTSTPVENHIQSSITVLIRTYKLESELKSKSLAIWVLRHESVSSSYKFEFEVKSKSLAFRFRLISEWVRVF